MRTLGIDPGSRLLGFGCVERNGNKLRAAGFGTLRFDTKVEANERLVEIYRKTKALLEEWKPDQVAIEKVFFAKNVVSALKLGQARGVVILAVAELGIPVSEYSPNEVKQATVGFGHADKEQVAKMVSMLLGIHPEPGMKTFDTLDASDALAIAICHQHSYIYRKRMEKTL